MLTLNQLREDFEGYRLSEPLGTEVLGLYTPAEYLMDLGGKRMRPVSLLIAFYIFNEKYHQAMPAALAVEVFHNFTLMHDDIMDEALVRRGHAAAHIKYGLNSAILSGDVMMIRSFDLLLEACDAHKAKDVLQIMLDSAREICEGQQQDMEFETRDDVSVDEYLEMNRRKTAALLATCMKIGAMLGGGSDHDAQLLYEAGEKFGIAFQVQDDVLDAYGDARQTGKKRGGDIVQSKKTFLYTSVLEDLAPLRKESFRDMYRESASNPEVKIQKVLRVFDEFDIPHRATTFAQSLYEEGMALLDSVGGSQVNKVLLTDFIKGLRKRNL